MAKHRLISFHQALSKCAGASKIHILLGNGFSRAWKDNVFSYTALLEQADFTTMSPSARSAFDALETSDFEQVMRALHTTATIARLYDRSTRTLASTLEKDARRLRDVLVKAIAGSHPGRPAAVTDEEYRNARTFLANFSSIYTLNYDLLLYWTLMQTEIEPKIKFDDGFRTPDDGKADYVTWEVEKTDSQNVHYLHGALHIYDNGYEIQKYTWINTGIPLIDQIRGALESDLFPVYVSEGESRHKLAKIKHSDILSRGLRSFAKIGGALFVLGHSMSQNDEHITRLIEKNKVTQLFVGIFGSPDSTDNKRIITRSSQLSKDRPATRPLQVSYFDSESAHVWR